MEYTQIRYEVADAIATITLARPEARNGFTVVMADELAHAFTAADTAAEVRAVILAADGPDFCVGMDLSAGGVAPADEPGWVEPACRVTTRIDALSKPVIAAMHGAAAGVGATMVLPADYRLAADDARFGFVFSRRGLFPEGGSVWFLPRLVGLGRASDWMMSGRIFDADEALSAGLVQSLFPRLELAQAARDLARELIDNCSPVSMAVIRQALRRMSALDSPEQVFALDSKLIAGCATSPDAVEGIMSFLQRRSPQFPLRVPEDLPAHLPWRVQEPTDGSGAGAASASS
ncbi:MAG: enoyl-CoA hydratase-related protein [Actinomycetota bacterium]|nr:enoyl-CoA hydratase-related protein [Actinomycetota bacterium]